MKFIALLPILLLSSQLLPAQDTLQTRPPIPTTIIRPVEVAVEQSNMKVLYMGVDNPLNIVVAGGTGEMFQAKISQGELLENMDGSFIVRPEKPGTVVLTISQGGTMARQINYRVTRVPDPQVSLGKNFTGGKIPLYKIRQQTEIVAELKDFIFDVKFEVISFDMLYRDDDGTLNTMKAMGSQLSEDMQIHLTTVEPRHWVFFEDIIVKGDDGSERNLGSLAFQVIPNKKK